MREDAGARPAGRGPAWLVLAGVALLVATRLWHPIAGLGNSDIGGILYEADIILDGGVPFRDTVDVKAPGTWFLFAAIFAAFGREIAAVQVVYAGWCLLAAPAVWLAARALYGRASAWPAAAAVLLYLATVGVFDLNYSSWMATPYAWAFAGLIAAVRGGSARLHALAGACAALAVVFKAQAVVLAPVFALVWLWGRRRGEPGATWGAWALWIAGAALGLAPLVLWYAWHGALPAVLAGLFPVEAAREYGSQALHERWWGWRAWWIAWQQLWVFPVQVGLAAAALLGAWWRRREPGDPLAPQLVFYALSVVGCGLGGMRFYVHYLPQCLPALALLAAHPRAWSALRVAWVHAGPDAGPRRWIARALALTLAATALWQLVQVPRGRAARVDHRGNPGARAAGEYIRARTGPADRVQVWGWAAWPVYFWADRRAPSPVFKVLGQVTDYNQNGMFSRSLRTDFKPGPHADTLLAAMRATPPAYFVRSTPFFPGVREDPLLQFAALREIVARDYVLRRRFGRTRVYELRARLGPEELARALRFAAGDRALPRPIDAPPFRWLPGRDAARGDDEIEDDEGDAASSSSSE